MARINIDEKLYRDPRFLELAVKLGSAHTALGALVMAWTTAQDYWKHDSALIPLDAWEKQRLPTALVECGLARLEDGGYYMAGSKEYFQWLLTSVANGKKGGRKSSDTERPPENSNLEVTPGLGLGTQPHPKPNHNHNPLVSSLSQEGEGSAELPLDLQHAPSPFSPPPQTKPKKPKYPKVQPLTTHWLMDLWNENSGKLSKAKAVNAGRQSAIDKVLQLYGEDRTGWLSVVLAIRDSDFCNGQNDRGWTADFDWLVQEGVRLKVEEGKYRNKVKRVDPAKRDWVSTAELVFVAVRKGMNYEDKLKFLGDDIVKLVNKVGGFGQLGTWQAHEFNARKLAGMLKAVSENNNNPSGDNTNGN